MKIEKDEEEAIRKAKETQRNKKRKINKEAYNEGRRKEQEQRRKAEKKLNKVHFNLKRAKEQQNTRLNQLNSVYKRRMAFKSAIRDGRTYLCISCHRKLFKNGVIALGDDWQEVLENFLVSINNQLHPSDE